VIAARPERLHGREALVADDTAGEADQDRGEGGHNGPIRGLPDGRGCHPSEAVPGHPWADSTPQGAVSDAGIALAANEITRKALGQRRSCAGIGPEGRAGGRKRPKRSPGTGRTDGLVRAKPTASGRATRRASERSCVGKIRIAGSWKRETIKDRRPTVVVDKVICEIPVNAVTAVDPPAYHNKHDWLFNQENSRRTTACSRTFRRAGCSPF